MTHTFDLETEEIEMVLEALSAQEKKCKTQAEKPIHGYGKASELQKKENWAAKAEAWRALETKLANQTIS